MAHIGWLRVLSVLFAALALVFTGAHLLELPHKIGMSAADYLTVQQIYRGWQFAGIVVIGEQERAQIRTTALGLAPAHDNELVGVGAFCFSDF